MQNAFIILQISLSPLSGLDSENTSPALTGLLSKGESNKIQVNKQTDMIFRVQNPLLRK